MRTLLCAVPVPSLNREGGEEDWVSWRARLVREVSAGCRLVTLFGRPERDEVLLTAVLERPGAVLEVLRTRVDPKEGYPSLTSVLPAFGVFERELHERLGVELPLPPGSPAVPEGVLAASATSSSSPPELDAEPGLGAHGGVIEPGAFRFTCLGPRVVHLDLHLGYPHRGVERLLREFAGADGRLWRALPLVETVAGDSTVAHATAYCLAIEALAGLEVGADVGLSRGILLELERIGMHLFGLSAVARDIAHARGAEAYAWLGASVNAATARLCGSRFGRGGVRIGAPGFTLGAEGNKVIEETLDMLEREQTAINSPFVDSPMLQQRLRGVGNVDLVHARDFGMVGLCARASGLSIDQRLGGIYEAHPVAHALLVSGDCWAREWLRVMEVRASVMWLREVLADRPEWGARRQEPRPLGPSRLAVGLVEGWRGEVVYAIETIADGSVAHVKVQDPSFRNWIGLGLAVCGNMVADFPVCNKSFDLGHHAHNLD